MSRSCISNSSLFTPADHVLQTQKGSSEEGDGALSPLRCQGVYVPVRQKEFEQTSALPV